MWTIDRIQQTNRERGFHFFDSSTMRFFRSRVMAQTFEGKHAVYLWLASSSLAVNTPRPANTQFEVSILNPGTYGRSSRSTN